MKKWIAAGILVVLLFVGTLVLLGSYFIMDLAIVFTTSRTTEEETTGDTVEDWLLASTEESTVETTAETTTEETTLEETTREETTTEKPTTKPTQKPTTKPTQESVTKPDTKPDIDNLSSKYAFVYDIASNQYLFAKGNDRDVIPPASLTKLFSAYVALQHLDPDTVITAGEEVKWIHPDSSRAWIYSGQNVTVKQCIQGMIMPSGNDAAYILAVAAGRAIKKDAELDAKEACNAFVAEMNNTARNAGITGTQFKNPDGIDEDGHYTTLYDLITISKLAMSQPLIMKYAGTYQETVTFVSGQTVTWKNSNWLLKPDSQYYCPEACGLKTGSTANAGKCLLSLFPKGDSYLLICVAGAPNEAGRYNDTLALYKNFQ